MGKTIFLKPYYAVITVPYAGKQIPSRFLSTLGTHAALPTKTSEIASTIAEFLQVECFMHITNRTLVNVQASLGSPALFSDMSKNFTDEENNIYLSGIISPIV